MLKSSYLDRSRYDGCENITIRSLTVKGLLGRALNDVEKKYAPDTIYVKGSMQTPLPKPRVSIVE